MDCHALLIDQLDSDTLACLKDELCKVAIQLVLVERPCAREQMLYICNIANIGPDSKLAQAKVSVGGADTTCISSAYI